MNDKFEKESFDLKEYLGQTIGIFKDESYNIKLKITYSYAQGFKEYCWIDGEEIAEYLDGLLAISLKIMIK